MSATARDLSRRVKRLFRLRDPNRFLKSVAGVIHVGANVGQERHEYARHRLEVVWIEPIPEVFAKLEENIAPFPQQRAVNCLITDRDGVRYDFHVATNNGASSSILDMHQHHDIWPEVDYERTIALESVTLPSFFRHAGIEPCRYDALVLDTQGSELLILCGAAEMLPQFRYIKTEVPDFEAYAGCCLLDQLDEFMRDHGFHQFARHEFAVRPQGGSYFDVIYERGR